MFVVAVGLLGLHRAARDAPVQVARPDQRRGARSHAATLNTRASGFAQDFDSELTRAYLLFQVEPLWPTAAISRRAWPTRYERWQATARYPRMIKDVYLIGSATWTQPLQRFNPGTRFLEPADWPAAMAAELRAQLRSDPAEPPAPIGTFFVRTMPTPIVWARACRCTARFPCAPLASLGSSARSTRAAAGLRCMRQHGSPLPGCRTRCCCSIATT